MTVLGFQSMLKDPQSSRVVGGDVIRVNFIRLNALRRHGLSVVVEGRQSIHIACLGPRKFLTSRAGYTTPLGTPQRRPPSNTM